MGNTCECIQKSDKDGKVQANQSNIIDIRDSKKKSIQKKKKKALSKWR